MKRKIATILCLSVLSLTLLALAVPARAFDGNHYGWVAPAFTGYDSYYDQYITGYVEGTNWDLTISWTNPYFDPINVSAIRVLFDWGKNYTFGYTTPVQVGHGVTQVFTVYNVTPSTMDAPELWTHSYQIFLDHVNDTAPPFLEYSPITPFGPGSGFAVLSADHLDCLEVMAKYSFLVGPVGLQAQMVTPVGFFPNITEAQVLLMEAMLEFNQGDQLFNVGAFNQASAHFDNGDSLFTEALTVWKDKGSALEDADLAYKNGQANYYSGQGDYYIALGEASKTNAYGWVLFGIGWVFIGIGVIVYGYRRPKPPQPPT
jgi:hypothetical protein